MSDDTRSFFDDEADLSDEQIEQILKRARVRAITGPVPVLIATKPLTYKDRIYTDSPHPVQKKGSQDE